MRQEINPSRHTGARINAYIQNWNPKENSVPKCWNKKYMPHVKEQSNYNRSIIVSQENLSWLIYCSKGGLHIVST